MPLDYYLSLLQLHVAVVGVIIAGIVALIQLLNSTKPRRDIRLLVQPQTLAVYGGLLTGLLVLLALGSWASAFPDQANASYGPGVLNFFSDSQVGLVAIVLMLISLGWFVQLSFKARVLLDSQLYLQTYVKRTPPATVHRYLEAIYADKAATAVPFDPFQPIREYTKDNAFKYYDYGTADGLRHFSNLFDKALVSSRQRSDQAEYVRLARYMSESCEELFRIFDKTASEKRKLDTINLLYAKGIMLLQGEHDAAHDSLLPIVRGLENIAKLSNDDDEVIAAIGCIRKLCDTFLDGHKQHSWEHIAGLFDEICLSVSRITETYYLQKNNSLKTVPIIGYATGEHRTVTISLVDFFCAYRDLGDRYTDATPLSYFEAIESVIEVLFVRLGDIVEGGQQNVGFNMKYHELARDLYQIYHAFGIDSIEHHQPELLSLSMSNLRRIIKPAKNFRLNDERQELCTIIVDLAARGIATFGDIAIKKDGRTITEYAAETLDKHTTQAQISTSIANLKQSDIDLEADAVKTLVKHLQNLT